MSSTVSTKPCEVCGERPTHYGTRKQSPVKSSCCERCGKENPAEIHTCSPSPDEGEIERLMDECLSSFTDMYDHDLYGCSAIETEPLCGDGCCGGGKLMGNPRQCDCGIAKGARKALEISEREIRSLQSRLKQAEAERDSYRGDAEKMARAIRKAVKTIESPNSGIVDTIWVGEGMTLVDLLLSSLSNQYPSSK